jgi:hypothetical protein
MHSIHGTWVADGTHHDAKACVALYNKCVSGVFNQEATAYFTSASVANSWPATCFLRCPKRWKSRPHAGYGPPFPQVRSRAAVMIWHTASFAACIVGTVGHFRVYVLGHERSVVSHYSSFSPQARFVPGTPRKHWTESVRRKRTDSRPAYSSCDPCPTGC